MEFEHLLKNFLMETHEDHITYWALYLFFTENAFKENLTLEEKYHLLKQGREWFLNK